MKHAWYYKNWAHEELKARDDALRRADLSKVIREQGVKAAKELHDKIMQDNPVPEPDFTVACQWCDEPYNEDTRMGECSGKKIVEPYNGPWHPVEQF